MVIIKRKWNLLAIVLAASAFMVAFGIALAATVQVSQQVPSTLNVVNVEVIADENLVISHDEEGNDLVTSLEFEVFLLQPPLEPQRSRQSVFIRNDSGTDLTLFEPCREIFANDDNSGTPLGFLFADKDPGPGSACGGDFTIAAGETVRAEVDVDLNFEEGVGPGNFSFTAVFGATGENGQ